MSQASAPATVKRWRTAPRRAASEHGEAPRPSGRQGGEPVPGPDTVGVRDSDPMVVKHQASAFNGTGLDRVLREQGVDTVSLSGLSAVGCVLATSFDADRRGHRVFMVRNGLMSHKAALTESVEEMTSAVGYEAISYMLDAVTD